MSLRSDGRLAVGLMAARLLWSAGAVPVRLLAQPGPGPSPIAKEDHPQALPAELVKAWRDAGAKIGWTPVQSEDLYRGLFTEEQRNPSDLPAFRFTTWKAGMLDRLPQPAAGFGLDLNRTQVTDAGITELWKAIPGLDVYSDK